MWIKRKIIKSENFIPEKGYHPYWLKVRFKDAEANEAWFCGMYLFGDINDWVLIYRGAKFSSEFGEYKILEVIELPNDFK